MSVHGRGLLGNVKTNKQKNQESCQISNFSYWQIQNLALKNKYCGKLLYWNIILFSMFLLQFHSACHPKRKTQDGIFCTYLTGIVICLFLFDVVFCRTRGGSRGLLKAVVLWVLFSSVSNNAGSVRGRMGVCDGKAFEELCNDLSTHRGEISGSQSSQDSHPAPTHLPEQIAGFQGVTSWCI